MMLSFTLQLGDCYSSLYLFTAFQMTPTGILDSLQFLPRDPISYFGSGDTSNGQFEGVSVRTY